MAKWDFFISYTSADKDWAEWIGWELENAGKTVFLQAWDFRPGGNFVDDIQTGLTDAERTLLVLSPDYFKSKYTKAEWTAAFTQDPDGVAKKLLPVRVKEVKPPGLLAAISYIDLVGKSPEEAQTILLSGIQTGRAKPTVAPAFPNNGISSTPSTAETFLNRPSYPAVELHRQLRETLLDCGPFYSEQETINVFADPRIKLWRNRVPSANNAMARMEAILAFLINKHTVRGDNGLALFLDVLAEREGKESACYNRLKLLAIEVKNGSKTVSIPKFETPVQFDFATGNVYIIHGDYVVGDKVGEDKVGGDKITVGNISDSQGIAIGAGATASINRSMQTVNQLERMTESDRKALHELIQKLTNELGNLSASHQAAKEEIASLTEKLLDERSKNDDKDYLEFRGEKLKQAAKNIATIAPAVVQIAGNIVTTILKFTG